MWREVNALGLNRCVALRKPLISEATQKKRFQFAREHKDWTLEQWKKVMWSDESRFTLFQSDAASGKKRGRWSDAPIMPSVYFTSLWGQCCNLGWLQLVRSSFSNIMCPKNEVSWLPEYTEWPHSSTSVFFLPWWHKLIETKPQRMHAVIKAKGGPMKY